jgi:hypothetical protein
MIPMWLNFAYCYCLLSWLVGVIFVRLIWSQVLAVAAAKTAVPRILFELAIVLLMPILLPCFLYVIVGCILKGTLRLRMLRRIGRTFRRYQFVPVDSRLVAESIGDLFETHTPPLLQLGFIFLGDYRLKPKPVEMHNRLFLSADGDILATICCVLNGGAVAFISVLENGTCVHTTSVKNPRPERACEPADQLCMSYVPGISVEELYDRHQHVLRQCSASSASGVLRFGEAQFREVMVYDQSIFNRWRFRHGALDNEPPAPDFRTLRRTPETC